MTNINKKFNEIYKKANHQGVSDPKVKSYSRTINKAVSADAAAYYHVAQCYENGWEGYSVDLIKADYSYRKAAECGHPLAQHRLGL